MKKILLWITLIILIILLILPFSLRLFGKNLYNDKQKENKDVVTVLNCKKNEDILTTTYFNNNPYDFRYVLKGDYSNNNGQNEINDNLEQFFDDSIINDIRDNSIITYSEENNTTEFHILLSSVEMVYDKLRNYTKLPNEQQKYYTNMGFYCTINNV